MGSVVKDMQANVANEVKLPAGYRMSWSGEFENQERAMKRLSVVVPISILLIFLRILLYLGGSVALGIWGLPWLTRQVSRLGISQAAMSASS